MTDVLVPSRRSVKRSAITAFVVLTMFVFSPTGLGWATPPQIPGEPEREPYCSYRLDPPRRVDLPSGVTAVTTTMAPIGCRGNARQVEVTACIQADDVGTQCQTGPAWIPAELNFRPWRPNVTYTATGIGCFLIGNPESRICTPEGPISVPL